MKIFKRTRAERQHARQERRAERQEDRQDRRADRQEARQERRANRQEARQDRRATRQEARQDRRAQRQEARAERREARREARAERRGESEEPIIIITDEDMAAQQAQGENSSGNLASACGETSTKASAVVAETANDNTTAGESGSSTNAAGFETAEEALELFESDEKAFFAKLNEIRAEDRGAWLMAIQTKLQATNQLTTAITNFQKAEHDTQKAVLANIRV